MAGEPLPATPAEPDVLEAVPVDSAADRQRESTEARRIVHDGETWVAEVVGRGTAGTGRFADPGVQLVRFTRSASPDDGILEVLTGLRELDRVHEDEILEWFRRARPPVEPDSHSAGDPSERVPLDEADGSVRADFD
jgi:hypothetical protein